MRRVPVDSLLLLAFLYRLAFLLLVPRVLDSADSVHYAETARHFLSGEFFAHNPKIPVFYPLLGAFFSLFTRDPEWGCRLVSFVFSTLTVLPVYAIAGRLHGPRAAWWAGLTVALWPWLADYACAVSTEATAVFLWMTGFWLLLQWRHYKLLTPVLTALVFFLLSITRAEGMFIALSALIAGAYVVYRPREDMILWSMLYGAGLFLMLALMTFYNGALTGTADPNVRVGYIVEEFDFVRFVETAADTLTDVIPIMLGPVLMVLLGIGLFAPREHKGHPREAIALLFLASLQVVASWFVLSPAPRYLMAPLIVLTMWSAAGLIILRGWIRNYIATGSAVLPRGMSTGDNPAAQKRGAPMGNVLGALLPHLPAIALMAFMALGTARTLGGEFLSERPRQPVEYKEAGLWMRDNLEPGLVFTRKPQVAYYAGMPSTGPLDTDSLDEALARARESGARYLVVDERYAPGSLKPLLDPAQAPPSLGLLHAFGRHPQARLVVYRMQP
ncbi:MAG: Dolichyl-phosphate-mannose-protein mannosyltransferase [Candidatus Hydrogenedentota bacterium]|jgi:hypothetical protein